MAPVTGAQWLLFKFFEKVLDIFGNYGILTKSFAGHQLHMGEFPSGQRGQTVNLLLIASVVRIHLPPPNIKNPNFFPVGDGFGFFVPIEEIMEW